MDSMTPALWRQIKDVATSALDCDEATRVDFVDRACGGDLRLRSEVLSLLAASKAATPYFETPGGGAVATLFPPGTRLGAYRIVRELATGGMGSVYLAERDDDEFVHRAAIKAVRGGFVNRHLLERFREERRILATLEHPNIARLLDGGTTSAGVPYVVMEYIEGEPIDLFCRARQLGLRERLGVFRQVCAAVQYAHQHLVVHRDIKPANILVTGDGVPKLLDFGIAKLLDAGTDGETTLRMMTPESASPEQVAGRPVTVASDVYALGVLLYRLLTGCSPYNGRIDSDSDLVRAVCEHIPQAPSAVTTGERIPHDVDVIVLKALRKEPERRYASAGELAEDISRYLTGRPVKALPDSLVYRSRKFVARHQVGVAAAVAVVLAVIAGVAATVWQARVATRERLRAERGFSAGRELARSVLGELHDAVEKLPGSTPAREILLRRGIEYLDALEAETQNDIGLRREVANGYVRLAMVQGASGLPNLGDRGSTRTNMQKAVALLEPLAASGQAELDDRLNLARAFKELASIENGAAADDHRRRAEAIVAALTPDDRRQPFTLATMQLVWNESADHCLRLRDYECARQFYEKIRDAAEEDLHRRSDSLGLSRNLSLAYKQLGASLEMLDRTDQAIPLYEKALALDEARVARNPQRPIWRLDLSFAHGALGAALMAKGDLAAARQRYERAVALREEVVAEDPADDFATLSLARGYERLAIIRGRQDEPDASIEYQRKRVALMAARMAAHPDRDDHWKDYAQVVMSAVDRSTSLLESPRATRRERRELMPRVSAMLDEAARLQERWRREKHAGDLPPGSAAIAAVRARLANLASVP